MDGSELGHHVPGTLDREERQFVVVSHISGDLAVRARPRLPRLRHRDGKPCKPALRADRREHTVRVARVNEHAQLGIKELRVQREHRAVVEVVVDRARALAPRDARLGVDGRLDIGAVDVRLDVVVDARRRVRHLLQVGALAARRKVLGPQERRLRVSTDLPRSANVLVDAVVVNVADGLRGLVDEVLAGRVAARKVTLARIERRLVVLGRDERVRVEERHRRIEIVGLVRERVACGKALEVDDLLRAVGVRVEDLLREVGDVVPGIRFARDEKRRVAVLGEALKPVLQEPVRILRRQEVVRVVVAARVRVAEADAGGRLEPENVGNLVPRVVVESDRGAVRLNEERPILSEEAAHGRAPRATVEPQHEGSGRRVCLRFREPVEEVAAVRVVDTHVAGVLAEGELVREAGKRRDLIRGAVADTRDRHGDRNTGQKEARERERSARHDDKSGAKFHKICAPMYSALI
eukprot:Opistho-1_new@35717